MEGNGLGGGLVPPVGTDWNYSYIKMSGFSRLQTKPENKCVNSYEQRDYANFSE
jgi:hypothetical protein